MKAPIQFFTVVWTQTMRHLWTFWSEITIWFGYGLGTRIELAIEHFVEAVHSLTHSDAPVPFRSAAECLVNLEDPYTGDVRKGPEQLKWNSVISQKWWASSWIMWFLQVIPVPPSIVGDSKPLPCQAMAQARSKVTPASQAQQVFRHTYTSFCVSFATHICDI